MSTKQAARGISLFSGVGGLDGGFIEQGVRIIRAWDNSAVACATYEANFGIRPKAFDLHHIKNIEFPRCDIVLAGPPCQGFTSLAGHTPNDRRNNLIVAAAKAIAKIRPRAFVIENVLGLKWQARGTFMRRILRILDSAHLHVEPIDIDCARMGLPQRRRRILIVGGRGVSGIRVIRAVRAITDAEYRRYARVKPLRMESRHRV